MRTFEDLPAIRQKVPLLLGLSGASGGGKTYSALRMMTGVQREGGGDIFVIDTEGKRSLHYADRFKFRHVAFGKPFDPLSYLTAIEYCIGKGAKQIIVDSMSHEHEGPGGVLEMHEEEMKRLGGGDRNSFPAWAKPKGERRRLIGSILQTDCHFVFCFRAKQKTKMASKRQRAAGEEALQPMGFMPIAGEEFVFELQANGLLLPNAGGVPTWDSDEIGERLMIKLPEYFRGIFADSRPLDEEHGQAMARWASGADAPTDADVTSAIAQIQSAEEAELTSIWKSKPWSKSQKDQLTGPIKERKRALAQSTGKHSAESAA